MQNLWQKRLCMITVCLILMGTAANGEMAVEVPRPGLSSGVSTFDPSAKYEIGESDIPFLKTSWGAPVKTIEKEIGISAEKDSNTTKSIRISYSIQNIGENLPVELVFTKDKLTSVRLTVAEKVKTDSEFYKTLQGEALQSFVVDFFDAADDHFRYTSKTCDQCFAPGTTASVGYLAREDGKYDLGAAFYPPAACDVKVLKNANYLGTMTSKNDITYYHSNPTNLSHPYTAKSQKTFTYSRFNYCIQVRQFNKTYARIPWMYIYFEYAGTKNPGSVEAITFTIDGTAYRFDAQALSDLTATKYREYAQNYGIKLGPDNLTFFEKLKKTSKTVRVTLETSAFSLNFDMPKQTKTQLVQGYDLFMKLGGSSPIYMDYMRFMQTPLTIF